MGRKSHNRSKQHQAPPSHRLGTLPPPGKTKVATRRSELRGVGTAAAVVVLLLVLVTAWAAPHVGSDTFMALAGGRDVFDGKLAKPDDWAFTTSGKVWLNQSWGFDALAYAAARVTGEDGLLALKALLLLAIAAMAVLAARSRGASWPSSLLVTAVAMTGARWFLELRANLATYALGCLLLMILYRCRARPQLVWLAVPVIAVWANLHGGFVLGFALLGLWIGAGGLAAFHNDGLRQALQKSLAPAGALAVSIALAGVANPFGIRNLTHPFTHVSSPEWRQVNEWHPATLTVRGGGTSAWELVLFVGFILGMAVWQMLSRRRAGAGTDARAALEFALFDAGLVVLMTLLGFSAIRFLPLALVLLAPLAAVQADAFLGGSKPWVIGAAAACLAAAMLPFAVNTAATYATGNPRFNGETFFQRMASADQLPSRAADFIADNYVSGRVFNDWPWESYLRWRCPQMKLLIGGRAQQIYSLGTLETYRRFATDPSPAATLEELDTHLAVVPLENEYLQIVDRLAFGAGAHWALIFYDGRSAVLADLNDRTTRDLADKVVSGRARFRDERVAALSRALGQVSSAQTTIDAQALADLLAANRNFPTGGGPWFVLFTARAHRVQSAWMLRTFEAEYASLTAEGGRSDRRLGRLQARLSCAQILANFYGRGAQATRWIATREELLAELEALVANR